MNIEKRIDMERRLVRHLIRTMKKHGWIVANVDGVKCHTEAEVMDAVFAVDESCIVFEKNKIPHAVLIVLGNGGYDAIADYIYSPDDDFEKIMKEEVDPYADKLEEEA